MIDAAAAKRGMSGWIEKTPSHLYYVDEIERLIPGALFVHVVRRGEDVLASIVDAQIRFDAFHGSLTDWVRRWNAAMRVHARCARRANHLIVSYEAFVESAPERLQLTRFLDLPYRLGDAPAVADLMREPWKAGAATGIVQATERKREAIFGPRVTAWLAANLSASLAPGADQPAAASRAARTGS
jgi:hypothetical protein